MNNQFQAVRVPVSYTHLDVYKRQVLAFPVLWVCIHMQFLCQYDTLGMVSRTSF